MECDTRLASLQLAVDYCKTHETADIMEIAQKFYDFFTAKENTRV